MTAKLPPPPTPPRIFLRDVDLRDLDWDGAEGDVHAINSPRSIVITHATLYIPESLLEEKVRQARAETFRQVRDKFREDFGPAPRGFGEWIETALYRAEAVLLKAQASRAAGEERT